MPSGRPSLRCLSGDNTLVCTGPGSGLGCHGIGGSSVSVAASGLSVRSLCNRKIASQSVSRMAKGRKTQCHPNHSRTDVDYNRHCVFLVTAKHQSSHEKKKYEINCVYLIVKNLQFRDIYNLIGNVNRDRQVIHTCTHIFNSKVRSQALNKILKMEDKVTGNVELRYSSQDLVEKDVWDVNWRSNTEGR